MGHYRGSCHCGAIQFEVDAEPDEITSCDCSLCVKKNARMIEVHESQLSLRHGTEALATYRWNSRVARHHFCNRCGIYVFHRKRGAPDHFGVNIFCLEGFDADALPVRQTDGATMTVMETPP